MGNFNPFGRFPIIALSYANKAKATGGEFVVDYDNYILYVADKDDPSKLINMGESMINQLERLDGDIIYVTVDGDTMTLTEFLMKFKGDSFTCRDVSNVKYITVDPALDDVSIGISEFNKAEVKGFSTAANGTVPRKINGKLEWVQISGGGSSSSGDGITSVPIHPGYADDIYDNIDEAYNNVYMMYPINNKLALVASRELLTKYISGIHSVSLPKLIVDYEVIEWLLIAGPADLTLEFADNIIFEYTNANQPKPNTSQLYTFKTWDGGTTWYATVTYYGSSHAEIGTIDLDKLVNKDYINNNYYNKQVIDNNYYEKEVIDNILSWDDVPDAIFGDMVVYGDKSLPVTITIKKDNIIIASRTYNGTDTTYSVPIPTEGNYVVTIYKEDCVTRTYNVYASNMGCELPILITIPGDVDLNGTLGEEDISIYRDIVNNEVEISDLYALAVADFNGDGSISMEDLEAVANKINEHNDKG